MDINTLNYTIIGIDEANMVIQISFEGHGVVAAQIPAPLPSTEQELHDLVRRFAPPVEVMEVLAAPVDLTFLKSVIGQELTTTRHSVREEVALIQKVSEERQRQQANEFVLGEETPLTQHQLADRETLKALIREVLAEQHG